MLAVDANLCYPTKADESGLGRIGPFMTLSRHLSAIDSPSSAKYNSNPTAWLGGTVAEKCVQRRLAAIVTTDVVGDNRLLGADEEGTLARLPWATETARIRRMGR